MKYLHGDTKTLINVKINLFILSHCLNKSSEETTMAHLSQKVMVTSVCVGGEMRWDYPKGCVCGLCPLPPQADSMKAKICLLFFLNMPPCLSVWLRWHTSVL